MESTRGRADSRFVRLPLMRFTWFRYMRIFPPSKAITKTSSKSVHSFSRWPLSLLQKKYNKDICRYNIFQFNRLNHNFIFFLLKLFQRTWNHFNKIIYLILIHGIKIIETGQWYISMFSRRFFHFARWHLKREWEKWTHR